MTRKSKVLICVLSLGLVAFTSTAAFSQAAGAGSRPRGTAARPTRQPAIIGLVNIQDAIIATNEGQKEFDALQARFGPKQNDLKALSDEVENLKKDLQARGDKLSEDERAKQVKLLETKQKTLQQNYEAAQTEFHQAEQEVINRIGPKMMHVLDKYAKNNGYTMIVDVSNPNTPVLWANPGTNITKDLVDAYNAEPPATVTPASPTPTTPKKP